LLRLLTASQVIEASKVSPHVSSAVGTLSMERGRQ
jgi:hypothetical protein